MILVGYELNSKAYRLWNPATWSIKISANVCFEESVFLNKPVTPSPPGPSNPAPPAASSSKGKTPETIAISIVDLLGDEDPLLPLRSPSPDPPPPPREPSPPRDDENRSPPRSDTPRPSDPNPDQPPSSTSPTPPPTSPDQSTSEVPDPTSATSVPSEPSTSRRKGTRIRKKTKRFTSGQSELGTLLTSEGDEFDDSKLDPDELFLNHVQLYSEGAAHGEPLSYQEAKKNPDSDKWMAATQEEFDSLVQMGVWEAIPRPKDRKVIGCKWVYKLKLNGDGSIARYKARLVAKGYTQIGGLDYTETHAPVTRLETMRLLTLGADPHLPSGYIENKLRTIE